MAYKIRIVRNKGNNSISRHHNNLGRRIVLAIAKILLGYAIVELASILIIGVFAASALLFLILFILYFRLGFPFLIWILLPIGIGLFIWLSLQIFRGVKKIWRAANKRLR